MSMSLPKIKSATQGDTQSEKNLKFKKLKLNTDSSEADIRARFKSLKTQRLNSLSRYSSVQEQREYKNEKIHLNLLEKKLITGTYDEAKETGNDLNNLKHKRDQFKVQTIQKKQQTQKIKQKIAEVKKQQQEFQAQKAKKDEKVEAIDKKVRKQKNKTEHIVEQFAVYDHMIETRKSINLFLEGKINEDKVYLQKIKSLHKKVQNELRQVREKQKNLQTQLEKINQNIFIQHKNREQVIYDKQAQIDKRTNEQLGRQKRSKQYLQMLDNLQKQEIQKQFYSSYSAVLANKFLVQYNNQLMINLQQKYQYMQGMYNRICSYNKFDKQQPSNMFNRYKQLEPEAAKYQQKIIQLQKQEKQIKQKNERLFAKYSQIRLTSPHIKQELQQKETDPFLKQQKQQLEQQREIQNLKQQHDKIVSLTQSIRRWTQRYAQCFDINVNKDTSTEKTIRIFQATLNSIKRYNKVVQQKRKKVQNSNNQ